MCVCVCVCVCACPQWGKALKRLNNTKQAQSLLELALSYSTTAGDTATIKAAIEKLDMTDEQEEAEL